MERREPISGRKETARVKARLDKSRDPQPVIDFLLKSDDPQLRQAGKEAEAPSAKGQPDETRLERAREFSREIIKQHLSAPLHKYGDAPRVSVRRAGKTRD